MGGIKRERLRDIVDDLRRLGQLPAFQAAQRQFIGEPFLMSERAACYEARRLYPGSDASAIRIKTAERLREALLGDPGQYPVMRFNRPKSTPEWAAQGAKRLAAMHRDHKALRAGRCVKKSDLERYETEQRIEEELQMLRERTPTKDLSRDMDWAYEVMGHKNLMPLESGCPSVSAFDLYRFAREPENQAKFIDKYLAFSHNKEKLDGGSSEEWEEDKRKQFSVLRKLAAVVVSNIESSVRDMMRLSPDDVVRVMRSLGWTVERHEVPTIAEPTGG